MTKPRKNMPAARLGSCPGNCSGGRDGRRQRSLAAGELTKLPESARDAIGPEQPYICGYCGCVYVRGSQSNRRLGTLDGMNGPGWHSESYP